MKWLKRLGMLCLFALLVSVVLVLLFLNPGWAYRKQTQAGRFTIYHNTAVTPGLLALLDSVETRLSSVPINDPNLNIRLCLYDGSALPHIIESLGRANMAVAGKNIIVMGAELDEQEQITMKENIRYDAITLLTHEAIHCLQFHHTGLWGSPPFTPHPEWKWEGYAELFGRGEAIQLSRPENTRIWESNLHNDWYLLPDSSLALVRYLNYALLSYACLSANGGDFDKFLSDTTSQIAWKQRLKNPSLEP